MAEKASSHQKASVTWQNRASEGRLDQDRVYSKPSEFATCITDGTKLVPASEQHLITDGGELSSAAVSVVLMQVQEDLLKPLRKRLETRYPLEKSAATVWHYRGLCLSTPFFSTKFFCLIDLVFLMTSSLLIHSLLLKHALLFDDARLFNQPLLFLLLDGVRLFNQIFRFNEHQSSCSLSSSEARSSLRRSSSV